MNAEQIGHVVSHSSVYNLKCSINHNRSLYIKIPALKPAPDINSYLKVKRQMRFHRFGFNFDSLLRRKIKGLRIILRFVCDVRFT